MSFSSNAGASASAPPSQQRCLNKQDWLELIYNAAIPLMIGVISLWIAIHQQKVTTTNHDQDAAVATEQRNQDKDTGRLQRDEDGTTARLQREEDKETARLQREEDQKTSRLQREEDRETARLQRSEDKETARLQRELDLNMTNDKRAQDYELAERERNVSETQRLREMELAYENRLYDLKLEDDNQKENVLLEFEDDLAMLLLEYGPSLTTPENKWWFILQMKTEAALRQLDPPRRTILISTLLEAQLFDVQQDKQHSLLFRTNLSEVQFGYPVNSAPDQRRCSVYNHLSTTQADMRYASFQGVCLYASPDFMYANLDYSDWSYSHLQTIYIHGDVSMHGVRFIGAFLWHVKFGKGVILDEVSFQNNVECSFCQFNKTSLDNARLDHSKFFQSVFASVSMLNSNLSKGSFVKSIFEGVMLDRANLSHANLKSCAFYSVSMVNCSLAGAILNETKFFAVTMTGCTGWTAQQLSLISNMYQTTLPNGTFVPGKKF